MEPMPPNTRKRALSHPQLPSVTLIGCGNWGTALALALKDADISLREIIIRKKHAADVRFAAALGISLNTFSQAILDADILWICTPDAAIARVAGELAFAWKHSPRTIPPIVFHSSGALPSTELATFKTVGASIASVHPLMTFPRRSNPTEEKDPLAGVPFAMEGDPRAIRAARKIIRALSGEPFLLNVKSKPLYHAFGAFASPMLVAALTAAMETGVAAGLSPKRARSRMRPLVERTVANFFNHGPQQSFSGPVARGDTATVARHLRVLQFNPRLRNTYAELARFALGSLPAQNAKQIQRLLDTECGIPKNKSASRRPRRASTA
jgi:predicted short-subunit dehydrogenase-like oxidoreductase (DUF2520 family)